MDGTNRTIGQAKLQSTILADARIKPFIGLPIGQIDGECSTKGMRHFLPALRNTAHSAHAPAFEPDAEGVGEYFDHCLRMRRAGTQRGEIGYRSVEALWMRNEVQTDPNYNGIASAFKQHSAKLCAAFRQQIVGPFDLDRHFRRDLLDGVIDSKRCDKR